ncbi:outer membrane protein [Legionella oakridgensis ATCC 33761 = DSM 21215]|uniref:Outer membrane protein n=1 Tax=Legionella oakridgensis ATCC 33761 = DSM 21215 TaxID=1268635 RepID=W0BIC7_9GAMM|nr:outer membrane protein [Legionella oakridgensis ATCC 33761 = DSM 21215]
MNWGTITKIFWIISLSLNGLTFAAQNSSNQCTSEIPKFRWGDDPALEMQRVIAAEERLEKAIKNPEYMVEHWIELPTSPTSHSAKAQFLSLREAILLALRYNPNIRNAELDRIIQRYQLRLAENQFELQYALAGTVQSEKSHYSGIGSTTTNSSIFTPEIGLKTKFGTDLSLQMDNNVASIGGYNPLLNFSISQPLLRGFGKAANEAGLLDAQDNEWLNKLNLQQAVMDQVTQVITSYRALILSGNSLQNERRQLEEAKKTYEINRKKNKSRPAGTYGKYSTILSD